MISCNLKGGIGNLLFQIAAIEYLGKVNNFDVGYYNIDNQINFLNSDNTHNPNLRHSVEYFKMFKNFKWDKKIPPPRITTQVPFYYEKINAIDGVIYDGFFQSEKYFPDREFILNLFEPSDFVNGELNKYKDILSGKKTCSIHIRRGDYLKFPMHFDRSIEYYKKGMEQIGNDVDKYLIFSDDMEWCKSNFIGDNYYFVENEKDYVEIFLQSICDNNIISSSSFSWWGAWLNKNVNKKVVGPLKWFKGNEHNYSEKDILPINWIKI